MLGTLLIFLLCIWGRSYVHYSGEWIILEGYHVPIHWFDVKWYGLDLRYIDDVMLRVEISVIAFGCFFCTIVFLFLVIVVKLADLAAGFPRSGYRLLAWFWWQ